VGELDAGVELDVLVAHVVFGARVWKDGQHLTCLGEPSELCLSPVEPQPYSTSTDAARWVVERLRSLGLDVHIECQRQVTGGERWIVTVGESGPATEASTAPLAICRAAIRVLRP
jgi:hypothetical protein